MSDGQIVETKESKEMFSGSYYIKLDSYNHLVEVAKADKRSISKQIEYLIEEYYKMKHGVNDVA